jgi:apolipoprotein N-acyltransferase
MAAPAPGETVAAGAALAPAPPVAPVAPAPLAPAARVEPAPLAPAATPHSKPAAPTWQHTVAARAVLGLAGGGIVALSLPPFGWWPLGIAGSGLFAAALAGQPTARRAVVGLAAGAGQLGIGLAWAAHFSLPGYLLLVLVESLFFAAAGASVPPRSGRVAGFAGALVLAEAARESIPFGGLPLGSIALGQAGGPLLALARLGGPLAMTGGVALLGAGLASAAITALGNGAAGALDALGAPATLASPWTSPSLRRCRPVRDQGAGLAAVAVVAAGCLAAAVAPNGGPAHRRLRVAVVQGGRLAPAGELPTAGGLLVAQLAGTAELRGRYAFVLWPEDVVQLSGPLAGSPMLALLGSTAQSFDGTLLAGVTEPAGRLHFRNELAAVSPSGRLLAAVEKAHRVPFGEYVPARSMVGHLTGLSAVPRDAIAGGGNGEMTIPAGRFAVTISYEAFFTERGRSGVRAGGEALLVPTNTASYAGSQVPAMQLAAARLQAVSLGRDLLQSATAGYSALVAPSGAVLALTPLGRPATLSVELPLRSGATLYERFGSAPLAGTALTALAAAWALSLLGSARRKAGGGPATRSPSSISARAGARLSRA